MMRDAEAHADEDRQRREAAEVRNQAETLLYSTEKFIAENREKVPAEAASNVEGPLAELKKALEGDDAEAIKSATEKVAQSSQQLGAAMYAQAQAEGGPAGDSGGSAPGSTEASGDTVDGDVVDAEVVDAEVVDEPEGDQK